MHFNLLGLGKVATCDVILYNFYHMLWFYSRVKSSVLLFLHMHRHMHTHASVVRSYDIISCLWSHLKCNHDNHMHTHQPIRMHSCKWSITFMARRIVVSFQGDFYINSSAWDISIHIFSSCAWKQYSSPLIIRTLGYLNNFKSNTTIKTFMATS